MFLRRILVPVEFSRRSRRALEYACGLAELVGAAVDVLHVLPPPSATRVRLDAYLGRPLPHASSLDVLLARDRLHDLMGACERRGVVPTLLVEVGDVAATIVRVSLETPDDLVVMGTRGHRGVSELWRGSIAHRVITCAGCPVVTLAGEPDRPLTRAAPEMRREP
jgi:nucleotide-binding universal stress UspA family protein